MKRARIELAGVFVAILLLPFTAYAQNDTMSFGEDEAAAGQPAQGGEAAAEGDTMTFGEGEAAEGEKKEGEGEKKEGEGQPVEGQPVEGQPAAGAAGVSDTDVLGALGMGGAEKTAATTEQPKTAEEPKDKHAIWAVQQVYALRARRFDLQPTFGVSLNDPYVQHQSFSLALSYYITEVLGVGLSFNWYGGLDNETKLNYSVSRATHQITPINEYQWGAQINFTYVPIYGKFAMFRDWILHWDVWVIGGGGFIFTRPIAVIDPDYREGGFDYKIKFCFNIGIGGRLYLTRFLAIALELRDYIFPEELESRTTYSDPEDRAIKSNWVDDNFKLTNNVMLQIGVTLFLPFTFEYKLPK